MLAPRSGQRIGPGYRVSLSTTAATLPFPTTWWLRVQPVGIESESQNLLSQQWQVTSQPNFLEVLMGEPSIPYQNHEMGRQTNVALDADANLQVYVYDGSTPVDSALFPVKWDPVGRLFAVESGGTTTGGFTATDRTTLQDTSLAVIGNPLDVLGGVLNFPWAEYFGWKPPPQFLARSNETFVLSGEGDLVPPVGRYGLVWQWTTVPVGIGRRPGVPTVYHAEMIVLSEIHRDLQSNEFVSQRVVSNTEGIPYAFLEPQPSRIHYQVLPFVQGVGQWLQLSPF